MSLEKDSLCEGMETKGTTTEREQPDQQYAEDQKQIFTPDERLGNDFKNKGDNFSRMASNETAATYENNLSEQTEKEISAILQQQQHRRDSSDSNSSLLSNSSTQSSTSAIMNFCTCTPQQLKQQQQGSVSENPTSSSFCSDHHPFDIYLDCDDELCDFHETFIKFASETESKTGSTPPKADQETVTSEGFFRRSIQQKIQYRPCTKNQQCSILRINRNRCQYCRLKKCIAVGMSRDVTQFAWPCDLSDSVFLNTSETLVHERNISDETNERTYNN
ncbi:unnamed protein product [Ceratitis capitata]|uniref:(Mediterranean fruit fly) hypothetical protein n=1 Tax=Ceratitis capitata TaxID=7213 RepID=A0A811V652_CERCA|nr:unnamed protein product [Ceratitis capitata]